MAEYEGKIEQTGSQKASAPPEEKVQEIQLESQGKSDVQTLGETQSLQAQLPNDQTGATEKPALPDLAVDAPQESEAKPTTELTAALTNGLLSVTATNVEAQENGNEGGTGTTELSGDSIAFANAAATETTGPKPKDPSAAQDCSAAVSKESLSDMPPPSFLPRQLRMKRKNTCFGLQPTLINFPVRCRIFCTD